MNTEDSERRYAQIEGERDYYDRIAFVRAREIAANRKRIAELEEREQVLAAHVEELNSCRLESGRIAMRRLKEALGRNPTASLARRDLIQRALELEALSLKMNKDWEGNDCIWPETLTDRYNELRQQAEAANEPPAEI